MAGVIESEIESLSLIFGENELVLIEPNQHIQLTISPLAEEARGWKDIHMDLIEC